MQNVEHSHRRFRPVAVPASGVALLLAFLLATHTFWCALAAPLCADFAPVTAVSDAVSVATLFVTHTHSDTDVCAGIDETKGRALAPVSPFIAPILIWTALVFLTATLALCALLLRAARLGRDGPTQIPPLHGRLMRASLPHRAPPVLLF